MARPEGFEVAGSHILRIKACWEGSTLNPVPSVLSCICDYMFRQVGFCLLFAERVGECAIR
jgi:hypothetical protein